MKRVLEHHSLRWIAAAVVIAIVLWLILRAILIHWNDRLAVTELPGRPYAESVEVAPGAPLFFTWGVTAGPRTKAIGQLNLPEEERFGDTYTQAHSVLSTLTADLREVGLTLRDVVNVRAYLVGDAENPPDFEAWDRAFQDYFGTAHTPHVPARTTVGISRLFLPLYRIEVEFIAAFPEGRGPFVEGSKPYRVHERLGRTETSEAWKSYGRPRFPMSTGKALRGGDGLFFSSAILPKPMNPMMPQQYWMFGPIANQASSIFQQTQPLLSAVGIDYGDLFFMRTIMFPEDGKPIGGNFGVFNTEYGKHLNNPSNPNRPTRTVMSAPGYTYRKQLMAVETYGLLPDEVEAEIDFAGQPVKAYPTPAGDGTGAVAVSSEAALDFFSGVVAPEAGDSLAEEARAALALVEERLSKRDLDLSNIVHLRAYLADDAPAAAVEAWEAVYAEHFGTETQAYQPALTTLPVVSLPGDRKIEIEILAARLPGE